jgi:hypothetical protein
MSFYSIKKRPFPAGNRSFMNYISFLIRPALLPPYDPVENGHSSGLT